DNIANEEYAIYAFEMTWSLEDGHSATQTFVREGEELPEYPDALYIIGGSLNTEDSDADDTPDGWQWDLTDVPMVPVHSNPHVFWKVVYLEAAGDGIKFAPQREWAGDFGVDAGAGETDGVYAVGNDNVPEVTDAGYYMVVVNLLDETVEVNDPMIYGIGDAFDTWDAAQSATLFTVDNTAKTATSPAAIADGDLRIHVAASTLTKDNDDPVDWWQAEFSVIDGDIVYRGTGGDLAAVPVTTGQTVTLNFTTETGVIE
ncbi:MAG: SusF/SusE family outer membrane protein, partial [Bacteroidales bacterium]|nr:SusF/SusE family outer membrane protein [Bacteroidales bacterium]